MRPTIPYQPALDGVRALAVVAVLLFHAGVAGFSGGYLGVSVFFTLSGYLITSLVLHERAATGSVSLGAFYTRRLRRLLPASLLCLAAIALAGATTDWFSGVERLRRDLLGALLQVANWVFLAGGGSYRDLLAEQSGVVSPVEHFWSLAIEEQFYWVWPPFLAWLLARTASPRQRLRAITAVAVAAVTAAPLVAAVWGPDAAYWATPARIGEILVGAWLAAALHTRRATVAPGWRWAAPAALVALGAAVVAFPAGGGPAYHGALPLVAVASAALLVGLQPDGPVRRALSTVPLVWVGRVSYGLYVYHWPLYLVLDEQRTGLDGVALLGVRLAATLAAAAVSYYAVEQPIRRVRAPRRRATFGLSLAGVGALAALSVAVVPGPLGDYWQVDVATAGAVAIVPPQRPPVTTTTVSTGPAPAATVPPPDREEQPGPATTPSTLAVPGTTEPGAPTAPATVRVLVVGDSTGQALATGLIEWAASHPGRAQVTSLAFPACGLVTNALIEGEFGDLGPGCDRIAELDVPAALGELQPDVVLVAVTVGDVLTRSWDGGTTWHTSADDEYQSHLAAAYETALDGLADGGATVAWARPPVAYPAWNDAPHASFEDGSQTVIEEVVAASDAAVADVRGWMEASGMATDEAARPDGVHLTPEAATEVAEWLGPELIDLAATR